LACLAALREVFAAATAGDKIRAKFTLAVVAELRRSVAATKRKKKRR
jgi:hypothetical protein